MRIIIAAALVTMSISPALAGWQWTEWGMSKDEVLAAAPGEITETTSEGNRWVLATTHDAVGFVFDAELWGYSTADGLMAVKLASSEAGACDAVTSGLREAYGADALSGASATGSYWQLPDTTKVQVLTEDGHCMVNYVGLAAPRTEGL